MFPSLLSRLPSPLLTTASTSTTTTTSASPPPNLRLPPSNKPLATTLVATAAAAGLLLLSPSPPPTHADPEFTVYYGTAASAANYGGYGGNASKKDTAEYVYDVPTGWKERLVSKVEKGTNGTDSEFFNPRKRSEKEYVAFLPGIRALAPLNAVEGAGAHSLISVTCARNKLYAHFVTAPNAEWGRDEAMLRRLHESFRTIQPGAPPPATES
ncbi:unnamed protein product [Urochloa humidicola]